MPLTVLFAGRPAGRLCDLLAFQDHTLAGGFGPLRLLLFAWLCCVVSCFVFFSVLVALGRVCWWSRAPL